VSKIVDIYNNVQLLPKSEQQDWLTVQVGSISAGEIIELSLYIQNNIIEDACFRVHGCGYAIALCAHYCHSLKGQPLATLNQWSPEVLAENFALPEAKYHALALLDQARQACVQKGY